MTGAGLRVLAVTNMYPTAQDPAFGAFVATQVKSLLRVGVDVQVEFINGRRSDGAYVAALFKIRGLARSGRFDVVHAHYGLSGFISTLQPLPLVVTFYGDDLLGTPNGRGGVTLKSRVIRPERLVLFPNTPGETRKRLDLAEAGVAALAAGGVAARLWVVTRVPHDQMPDHFRAADCLLLTSDWEGSPNVVKEALCCDTPVVSVAVGDVRRWLDLAPGCRLVDRTPAAIAAGLRDVLCGAERVDGSVVRNEVSADRVAARVLDVYRAVTALGRS